MILRFVSKFVLQIMPSLVATLIGAYIVNYYIVPKAQQDRAAQAAAASRAASAEQQAAAEPATAETAPEATSAIAPPLRPASPETAAPARPEPMDAQRKQASAPAREKSADDKRDATAMARAVIERLRLTPAAQPAAQPHPPETSVQVTVHAQPDKPAQPAVSGPVAATNAGAAVPASLATQGPSMQPLPPPVVVMPSLANDRDVKAASMNPRQGDGGGLPPMPPVEIPVASNAPPLDLHPVAPAPPPKPTTVADDVLSAAKSVFEAINPIR